MPNTESHVPRRLHQWLEPELFQPFIIGIFLCLSLSEFVRGALTLSLLPTYGRSVLHFAVEWTALALSLHYLVDNLLRAPSGWLVDRVGERTVLLVGFVISTASVFWMMHAGTVVTLILSLCGFGVGANAVWPAAMAGIGHGTPEGKRASFMSYLYIFWLLGAGLGPVIINFLVGGTYRVAFWFLLSVDAAGFLTAFTLVHQRRRESEVIHRVTRPDHWWNWHEVGRWGVDGEPEDDYNPVGDELSRLIRSQRRYRRRRKNAHQSREGYAARRVRAYVTKQNPAETARRIRAHLAQRGSGETARRVRAYVAKRDPADTFRRGTAREAYMVEAAMEPGFIGSASWTASDWSAMWQNIKDVAFLFPGMFAQTFAVASLIPILSVYANAILHLSGAMYSAVLVSGGSITVLGLIPTGRLIDKVGPRVPLVLAFLTAGVGLALFPLFRTLPFTFGLVCLFGAAYAFILPAWNAVLDKSIDNDKKGALWGVFMTVEGFGSAAGPYLGGLVWDHVGPLAPFWVSAGVILAMGLLYMVLPIERRYRTRYVRA